MMSELAVVAAPPATSAGLPFDFAAVERAGQSGELRRLAQGLARGGLRPAALRSALGIRYPNRPAIEALQAPLEIQTLCGALAWLFVAGMPVPSESLSPGCESAPSLLDTLERLGFAESTGALVEPRVSILPIAGKLLLCEPPACGPHRDLVAAPDLSAFHIIDRIGSRGPASWLDAATGTGVIGLAGSRSGCALLGTDLNARAIAFAQASSWLNGANGARWRRGDLFDACERGDRFELVTFNPPIAEIDEEDRCDDLPLYVAGAPGLVDRFWREVPNRVEPHGEVVTHTAVPEDPDFPRSLGLPGAFAVYPFTLGARDQFWITSWRPGAPDHILIHPSQPGECPNFGG